MSEVAQLQLIALSIVGIGILILLFIKATFVRVTGFVFIVLGLFSLMSLAAIGQTVFFSKGQCALCHSIGPSESARCPDLKGIGAKLSKDFLYESLTDPQAFVYQDYRHGGVPKEYPATMPAINKDPIGLSKNEIMAVIAFLQQMSGEPISVSLSDLEIPGQAPSAPVKAAGSALIADAHPLGGTYGRVR
jgi:hypothetical protein